MIKLHVPIEELQSIIEKKRQILLSNRRLALQETAEKLTDAIEKRIFEDGKNSAGVRIGTGTVHKDGSSGTKYSKSYAKVRAKEGLQIGFIDFKRTGKLKGSLRVVPLQNGSVRIEFADNGAADIAGYLDKLKGRTFKPSKLEIATAKRNFIMGLKSGK